MEGQPLDETGLVERARTGDLDAYGELVQRYSDLAFRTAYLITGSAADAEEACQDGLVAAFGALSRFRAGAPLRPWLLRIVANRARNLRREQTRRGDLDARLTAAARVQGEAPPSPDLAAEAAEERAALVRALGDLREEERLVVACRFLLDLSTEETARVMDCAEGTVKSRLSRALERLRGSIDVGIVR